MNHQSIAIFLGTSYCKCCSITMHLIIVKIIFSLIKLYTFIVMSHIVAEWIQKKWCTRTQRPKFYYWFYLYKDQLSISYLTSVLQFPQREARRRGKFSKCLQVDFLNSMFGDHLSWLGQFLQFSIQQKQFKPWDQNPQRKVKALGEKCL